MRFKSHSLIYQMRHLRLSLLNNFSIAAFSIYIYWDSYIRSVTSVNLKKAGMASRHIVIKKGSCLLWVMSTEISVDIAVDIAVDSRSTVGNTRCFKSAVQ